MILKKAHQLGSESSFVKKKVEEKLTILAFY
jgi:hypothetical protein